MIVFCEARDLASASPCAPLLPAPPTTWCIFCPPRAAVKATAGRGARRPVSFHSSDTLNIGYNIRHHMRHVDQVFGGLTEIPAVFQVLLTSAAARCTPDICSLSLSDCARIGFIVSPKVRSSLPRLSAW
jgi:hypothetical protein